ncbi:MAG: fibronectin type III domain-containing protein [Bacteroidota bacterium]
MKRNYLLVILLSLVTFLSNNSFSQDANQDVHPPNKFNTIHPNLDRSSQTDKTDQNKIPRNDNSRAVNVYSVTRTTGITYTPLAGASPVSSWRNGTGTPISRDDNLSNNQPIGFPFVYNGVRSDSFRVSTNGFITFNTTSGATGGGAGAYGYDDAAFTIANGTVTSLAGLYEDMYAPSLTTSIVYKTAGSSPNRILTVEWIDMKHTLDTLNPSLNFQVKLYEADGHLEYIYSTMTTGAATYSYTCGINASTLSAVPTAGQLLIQQTANTNTFSNTIVTNLATLPAANSMLSFNPPAQTAPAAPTSLTFSNLTGTSLTLNWVDNSSNETEFPIYISTDGTNFSYIGAAAANATSIGIINLLPSTNYFFQVYAANETKYSTSSANNNTTTLATVPLSGAYTINPALPISATNFKSFNQADTALSTNGVSGPCVFTVSGGVYTDSVYFGPIPNTSSTNTVKFTGPLSDARVVFTVAGNAGVNVCIGLFGTDWTTFENIDVLITSTTMEYGYYISQNTAADGANNNTIKNANITMNALPNFGFGVFQTLAAGSSVGNNGNTYQNLNINSSDRGIGLVAAAPGALPNDNNCVVRDCSLGQTTFIGNSGTGQAIGMLLQSQTNINVFNNTLYSVKSTSAANVNSIFGLLVQNASGEIFNNKILEVFQGNTTSTSATLRSVGIQTGALIGGLVYYNNFIANVRRAYTGAAAAAVTAFGVRSTNFTGGGGAQEYYYNTIYMSATAPVPYSSVAFGSFAGGVIMITYDNIFFNNISTTSATASSFAIWDANAQTAPAPSGVLGSNFNDLYTPGTNGAVGGNGNVGNTNPTSIRTTLAAWQSNNTSPALSLDTASSSVNVTFVNAATGDLHLAGASIGDINLLGTPITGITTDIDGNTRGTAKPYMGADEGSAGLSTLNLKVSFEIYNFVDTITVELRNNTSPYALVESVKGLGGLSTNQPIHFANAVDGVPYCIVVKYRNGIPTWSSLDVTFGSHIASYDFTSSLSKAYASNMKIPTIGPSAGVPSIYQGKVASAPGVKIGLPDIISIKNANTSFTFGYNINNLENNGFVGLNSILTVSNNNTAFVIEKPRP